MKNIFYLILLGICSYTYAQDFPVLTGDYLGQTPPGDTPVVFARGIISDKYQQHGAPAFSPDGNRVFWQTNRLDNEENWLISVMTMQRVENTWTEQEITSFGSGPVFSPDGHRLYNESNGEGDDPSFVEIQGTGWSESKSIALVTRFPEIKFAYNLSIAGNGTLYFLGYAAGLWNNLGIYRAELVDGEYIQPELLPPSINLTGGIRNWTPYIAPDESYLIFCSTRGLSLNDEGDLFISFRQPDGNWMDPVSLGAPINTKRMERFPVVSPDGNYLFFTRDTPGYDEDVYWVSADIIVKLKAEAFAETVTDFDGNVYKTVTIGNQVWMAENLKTTKYRNGDAIGTTDPATFDYFSENNPKYQWAYAGEDGNVSVYGRLYTWYAVTDSRNIAPAGWHVPTIAELQTLVNYLGGEAAAHGKLKESGVTHWQSPNSDATNESGFTALPGGSHWGSDFVDLGNAGHFWTTSSANSSEAWRMLLNYNYMGANTLFSTADKKIGWSVRCIKDTPAKVNDSENQQQLPGKFNLRQNYPNPFNPITAISYQLATGSNIKIQIYDTLGQVVTTLVDSYQREGEYSIIWNGRDEANNPVSSGIYFYTLETCNIRSAKKMTLIR